MTLGSIPFDGLFAVYERRENGELPRVLFGFAPDDIPEKYRSAEVIRLYPFDDSIIVEVKEV